MSYNDEMSILDFVDNLSEDSQQDTTETTQVDTQSQANYTQEDENRARQQAQQELREEAKSKPAPRKSSSKIADAPEFQELLAQNKAMANMLKELSNQVKQTSTIANENANERAQKTVDQMWAEVQNDDVLSSPEVADLIDLEEARNFASRVAQEQQRFLYPQEAVMITQGKKFAEALAKMRGQERLKQEFLNGASGSPKRLEDDSVVLSRENALDEATKIAEQLLG
jgi:hypothetical protein